MAKYSPHNSNIVSKIRIGSMWFSEIEVFEQKWKGNIFCISCLQFIDDILIPNKEYY